MFKLAQACTSLHKLAQACTSLAWRGGGGGGGGGETAYKAGYQRDALVLNTFWLSLKLRYKRIVNLSATQSGDSYTTERS